MDSVDVPFIDAMTDSAFGPLVDRPRYVPDGVSRIQEALKCPPASDGRRGCRKIGRVTFHRPIVAPQRRRTAVSKDGSRGPLPLSGRGRIRTAGSRRDPIWLRSHARV